MRHSCRNPLTGLCGLQHLTPDRWGNETFASQSPYGAKWFATWDFTILSDGQGTVSQSPYGAKWFATSGGTWW